MYLGSIQHYLKSLTIKNAICSKCIRYVFFMFWRAREEALQNIYSIQNLAIHFSAILHKILGLLL